jgi:hypothetical protein
MLIPVFPLSLFVHGEKTGTAIAADPELPATRFFSVGASLPTPSMLRLKRFKKKNQSAHGQD